MKQKNTPIAGTDECRPLSYSVRTFLTAGKTDVIFGRGIADLLQGIKDYGSLSKSAESMGMAYSKAWKILKRVETYLGFSLVFRQVGRGIGSQLTEKGEEFLKAYYCFYEDVNQYAGTTFQKHFKGFL